MSSEYKPNHCKAIITLSTIKGYANGAYKCGLDFDTFTQTLQEIEEHKFSNNSISWLVYPAKTIYKTVWGAPRGGEELFVLETDYTEYDKGIDIHVWKRNVINHAEYLRNYFNQETARVQFIDNVSTTILR